MSKRVGGNVEDQTTKEGQFNRVGYQEMESDKSTSTSGADSTQEDSKDFVMKEENCKDEIPSPVPEGENQQQEKELNDLKAENSKLEQTNQRALEAIKQMNADTQKLRKELDDKIDERKRMEQAVREKEQVIEGQKRKLNFFKEKLEVIVSNLDNNNPARDLILELLNNLSTEGSASM